MNNGSKGSISIMKKFITIAVLLIHLWILPFYAYAVTVSDVMAWGAGAWQGTTRIIPSLVKISGGAAAGNFYRVAFGWPGVAAMAVCLAGQYAYNHRNDTGALGDAIRAFLTLIGYRATVDGVEKGVQATEGYLTPNQAALDSMPSIYGTGTPRLLLWFSNETAAHTAYGTTWWHSGMQYIAGAAYATNAGRSDISLHPAHTGACSVGIGNNTKYIVFLFPRGSGSVTAETSWQTKTAAQLQTDATTALSDGTVAEAEKSLWTNFESIISTALRTNDTSVLGMTNSGGKTLDTAINEQTEAAINTDSTPAEGSTGVIEAINNLTNRIGDLITGAVTSMTTAIQNALGLSDTVADQTNTGIDVNENDTVIDSATIAGELNAQKAVTVGYLDALFDAITGLADRMKAKVESMVNAGSGVCSLSFSVYGQNQSLDFCSIDFSAIRAALLFVATIAAVMIILL